MIATGDKNTTTAESMFLCCIYSLNRPPSTGEAWRAVKSGQARDYFFTKQKNTENILAWDQFATMLDNILCSKRILFSTQVDFSVHTAKVCFYLIQLARVRSFLQFYWKQQWRKCRFHYSGNANNGKTYKCWLYLASPSRKLLMPWLLQIHSLHETHCYE